MYPSVKNPSYGVFVKNLASFFCRNGAEIELSVIYGRGTNPLNKLFKYICFAGSIIKNGLLGRYDCIYVHYLAHSLVTAMPIIFFRKIPLICNAHGEDLLPTSLFERSIFFLVRRHIAKAQLIVVPSEYFGKIARERFPKSEIFISPSAGVDLDLFKPSPEYLISHTAPELVIGYVSRIGEGKGWDVLIYAVKKLRDLHPRFRFKVFLVGEGPQTKECLSLIQLLKLDTCVSYLGAIPQNELPDFYRSLSVFVFPTTRSAESLGLVGLEALACGVPAICSDIGGIKEYMQNGINGYLFPPGDANALCRAIVQYSQLDDKKLFTMKIAARSIAQQYGSAKVCLELYKKIIEILNR